MVYYSKLARVTFVTLNIWGCGKVDAAELKWCDHYPGSWANDNTWEGDAVWNKRLREEEKARKAKALAERFDLDLSRKIGELSRGNRQKVGLIQAFMSDPKLLILDEPTTGLDPLLQQEFHTLVLEEAEAGKTLFVSSHVLPEVEVICDRVGIIREGSIVAVEEVATLRKQTVTKIEIEFGQAISKAEFEGVDGVSEVTIKDHHLSCNVTGSVDSLIKLAARYTVVNIQSGHPALEEVFLTYYSQTDKTVDLNVI